MSSRVQSNSVVIWQYRFQICLFESLRLFLTLKLSQFPFYLEIVDLNPLTVGHPSFCSYKLDRAIAIAPTNLYLLFIAVDTAIAIGTTIDIGILILNLFRHTLVLYMGPIHGTHTWRPYVKPYFPLQIGCFSYFGSYIGSLISPY